MYATTRQTKVPFANGRWTPTPDLANDLKLAFRPELLRGVSQPAALGREERLVAIPNSLLKVMFAQTIRTIAITFYCLWVLEPLRLMSSFIALMEVIKSENQSTTFLFSAL